MSHDGSHSARPRNGTARDVARAVKARHQIEVAGGTDAHRAGAGLPRRGHHRGRPGLGHAGPGPGGLARGATGPTWPPSTWSRPTWPTSPSATTWPNPRRSRATGLPRHLGTLHGRQVRHLLHQLAAPVEDHVLGFPGRVRPLLGVPGVPAVAGPDRAHQGSGAVPPDRGPLGLGAVRLGAERQLAARRGPPGRAGPRRGPAGPAAGQGPGVGPRLQAPLPGGRGHHPPGRPLLQDGPGPAPRS